MMEDINKRYCMRCDQLFLAGHKCTAPLKGQYGKFNAEPKEYSEEFKKEYLKIKSNPSLIYDMIVKQKDEASPECVGIKDNRSVQVQRNEIEHIKVWNAAIEAAAVYLEKDNWRTVPDIIRELKK
jgi:hypothetical protein